MSSPGDIPALPEHLYVHVPLCRTKCAYCDFFSVSEADLPLTIDALTGALVEQTLAWAERGLALRPLQTLYVGGGTPSMLGPALAGLVDAIGTHVGFAPGAEVTVEANPDSLDDSLVALLAEAGVTRVSLGVQSFHDDVLHLLGRAHDATRALAAARSVRDWNLDLSVDLMCGIPGQSMGSWLSSVELAIGTGAGHVSVYPLSLESGTPLAAEVLLGRFAEPDPDIAADMMIAAGELLALEGFKRYEIANYAKPGAESRHNTAYWTGKEYLAVGPGAHGMLSADTARTAGFIVPAEAARVRYAIACELQSGLQLVPRVDVETLTADETMREDVMLGLRLTRGVPDALVERAGVSGVLGRLEGTGLVERAGSHWRLTEGGWLLGNEVFGEVWAGE
jgi:oxygen-independent coproporphyrinogen-3 oxidase